MFNQSDFLDRMRETLAPSKTYPMAKAQPYAPPVKNRKYRVTMRYADNDGADNTIDVSVDAQNAAQAEQFARATLAAAAVEETIDETYEYGYGPDDDDYLGCGNDDCDDCYP